MCVWGGGGGGGGGSSEREAGKGEIKSELTDVLSKRGGERRERLRVSSRTFFPKEVEKEGRD